MTAQESSKNYYGSTVILTSNVKYIHDDPELELFGKCCEHVCKIFVEIEKEKNDSARTDK